ncbi:MAG: hypothetical protein KGH62_03200, partial [Candidatus Micrarchaeota archaeon]|nr:hypothetical protein [Candidatus Micrarchaeota archaeon]
MTIRTHSKKADDQERPAAARFKKETFEEHADGRGSRLDISHYHLTRHIISDQFFQIMADKGISSTAVNALAGEGRLGQLVQDLILRVDNGAVGELINSAVNAFPMDKISGVTYHGSETENMWIDLAIKHGKNWRSDTNGRRTKSGMGATPLFSLDK